MHEVALVEALLESVQEQIEEWGGKGRVRRVEVIIGRLSGVVPEAFRFAFDVLAPDTLGPGCELTIQEIPALCRCRQCGETSPVDELPIGCPRCQSGDIVIEGGRELLLQSIELEEDDFDDAAPNPVGC